MSQTTTEAFAHDLQLLCEKHEDAVNVPTRVHLMLQTALIHLDVFKITHSSTKEALTEAEFLEAAKRTYWKTREQLQAEPRPAARPGFVPVVPFEERGCENCKHRQLDADDHPFCAAVNIPFGRMLISGKPIDCGDANRLWESK